jgi:hypothetical protein
MQSDDLVQTGFLNSDSVLSQNEMDKISRPMEVSERHWGKGGPKPVEAYSFSEAIDAARDESNLQLSWMPETNILSDREMNTIVHPYLPASMYKVQMPGKTADVDYDHASFSESLSALNKM